MRRNTHFDYSRRESLMHNDFMNWGYGCADFAWTSELANADGAHYHVWILRGEDKYKEEQTKEEFKRAAKRKGDPVSFSWDYIPKAVL